MMETPEKWPTAIALEFPAYADGASADGSFSCPPRMPRRLRLRLLADCSNRTPCTVEDIEAKLRDAHFRRQQFYEKLSSKARPKPRSPPRALSQEEDLGQRLEEKLQAAEQKRLSLLAKEQLRLAKLDELRQAAKSEVELRLEEERQKLGTKVESRFQQAEANRLLMLKAYNQRRATLKERSSQSVLRRMARESKYKESVRAAINKKRAAAEKKRLRLLEAERKRACARVLQVQRVAELVSQQREIERKNMQDQLEDRLQRAKRQRAEYLNQRGVRKPCCGRVNRSRMHKQADVLSRKLARCWREFLKMGRTTFDLAKTYEAIGINEACVKKMPFEQLAVLIESSATLQNAKALLDRLESRIRVSRPVAAANVTTNLENIDHLLKRVATPKKRPASRTPAKGKMAKKVGSSSEAAKGPARASRYPVRVAFCAYMILGHPAAVFSGQGDRERALVLSAREFVHSFELLIRIILGGPIHSSDEDSDSEMPKRCTFRTQLAVFDRAWCAYLNSFVAWKVKDAKLLEDDLVRAACQLELSMIQTCKLTVEGDTGTLTHDMKAVQRQVIEDQRLLREKVLHLSGDAGIVRMEFALSETRSKYFQAKENGSSAVSPVTRITPSSTPSPPAGISSSKERTESSEKSNHVVRSLFKADVSPLPNEFGSLTTDADGDALKSVTENEMIVNALLHDNGSSLVDNLSSIDEGKNAFKGKIRETMEKAFWDGIIESVEMNEPQYDRVVQLLKEVRDEMCNIAPESWKGEIIDSIDLDILSQVMKSGNLDIEYLMRILEFSMVILQKLSSPDGDKGMKSSHQQLIEELSQICEAKDTSKHPHAVAMVKGLRFVLEQIQALKLEISKSRIRLMEPMLKGTAGFDYLRSAFTNRCGSPSDALSSLPLTSQWLSSVKSTLDQEWNEHTTSLSSVASQEGLSQVFLPSGALKTGGRFLMKSKTANETSSGDKGNRLKECKGERVDLLVRIGLLKLACRVSGLTQETLPETFMLNFSRLRVIQAQIQKIIVIATSILVCRQTLLSERVVSSLADMESILSNSIQQLAQLLDRAEDAGIEEIVDILSDFPAAGGKPADPESRQSRKAMMGRMLAKSLQAGNPVFERVSTAIYLALRAVVLGGNSPYSRKLIEMELKPIGAVITAERVVEAAAALGVAASISVQVHGQWFKTIFDSL